MITCTGHVCNIAIWYKADTIQLYPRLNTLCTAYFHYTRRHRLSTILDNGQPKLNERKASPPPDAPDPRCAMAGRGILALPCATSSGDAAAGTSREGLLPMPPRRLAR